MSGPMSKSEYVARKVAAELNKAGITCVLWNQAAMGVYGFIDKPLPFEIKTVDFIVSDEKFDLAKSVLATALEECRNKGIPIHLDLGHSEAHFLCKPEAQNPQPTEAKMLVGLVRQRTVLWGMPPLDSSLLTAATVPFSNLNFVSAEHPMFPMCPPGTETSASVNPNVPEGYGRYGPIGCQAFVMRPKLYAQTLMLCAARHYKGKRHVPIEADVLKAMGDCLDRYKVADELQEPFASLYRELRKSDVARTEWVQRAHQALFELF
ncbi:unnamed protein product [Clonostachys solani]|uniref:Uncharacterized protein n=1 Tax=Clonostachys solani TaxID=160281 RepID=A0A9N9ZP63_9HYPO|nr:unnamed protein product [Clonostachys solani]